ncbi:MAG: hypothetical protein J6P21_02250 [Clostridia bacterium]|nr:hypothetical protein [Clostridia bacterium]
MNRKASKRKQIKKQKNKSWKEDETNNKFYEQSERGNDKGIAKMNRSDENS